MNDKIANKLAAVRSIKGIQQKELAARCGMAPARISEIESGKRVPLTSTALKIARELDTTVEESFSLPE